VSDQVDYYDVQNMIRDARSEIRGEIDNAVREAKQQTRTELDELREELRATQRVLASRTEHLV
jgi:vacuolar-type H+-ATPase subunit H